ncbi:heme/hemin ABC transporter substrate-binding protein [Neolewinella agarilytica]|uniref:Iron complex transport system substrate-binding protein n=1 Tax=Neolewinella agarilytica TaxID=478744 RepID=A0A1H9NEM5_9BACT|nr:ABC transporter substrate-binding protein [Neolewinella agarilytica]SER34291.1 iron complex transport system substrate-binding protein [Neolewinella agarilytica]
MKFLPILFLLFAGLSACSPAAESAAADSEPGTSDTHRIVSLSGTLTELLYDLDFGDQLVGVDVTSTYPSAVNDVPKLGHVSQLNVEGLLALHPTLVFVAEEAKDKPALKTLADAGVTVVPVTMYPTLDNAARAATVLARHLSIDEQKIAEYTAGIEKDKRELEEKLAANEGERPRVLFIYARGARQLMVAGTDTEAAAIIELAGGENAIQSFSDFKPLTPEALVEAAPEFILMFTSGLASLDGKAGLANIPGISQTPAFQHDQIIAMDGHYLLGFGPRAAQAAGELAGKLHNRISK